MNILLENTVQTPEPPRVYARMCECVFHGQTRCPVVSAHLDRPGVMSRPSHHFSDLRCVAAATRLLRCWKALHWEQALSGTGPPAFYSGAGSMPHTVPSLSQTSRLRAGVGRSGVVPQLPRVAPPASTHPWDPRPVFWPGAAVPQCFIAPPSGKAVCSWAAWSL